MLRRALQTKNFFSLNLMSRTVLQAHVLSWGPIPLGHICTHINRSHEAYSTHGLTSHPLPINLRRFSSETDNLPSMFFFAGEESQAAFASLYGQPCCSRKEEMKDVRTSLKFQLGSAILFLGLFPFLAAGCFFLGLAPSSEPSSPEPAEATSAPAATRRSLTLLTYWELNGKAEGMSPPKDS